MSPKKSTPKRLLDTYAKLGIAEAELETQPRISHLVDQLERRDPNDKDKITSGRPLAIELLHGSEEEEARKCVAVLDKLQPWVQDNIPLEAICVAAKIKTLRLWGVIVSEATKQNAELSSAIAAINHPRIVKKSIQAGLGLGMPDSAADRTTLHKATGFLPSPKGAMTTINVLQQQLQQQKESVAQMQSQVSEVLPGMDDTIRKLSDKFNEKVLEGECTALPELPNE